MKTRLFVSLAAALAMTLSIPTSVDAVGLGKQCGGFPGIACDPGLLLSEKTRAVQHHRHVRHLRKGAKILHTHLQAGLRLRRQDLWQ